MLKDLIRKAQTPNKDICRDKDTPCQEPPLLCDIKVEPQNLDVEVFPGVVSEEYERKMVDWLVRASKNWKRIGIGGRRAAIFGGEVTPNGLIPETLPAFLQSVCDRLSPLIPNANHVLVNVYDPGEGILPHTDGPAYYPKVCVLSLGSACLFNISDTERLLPARSLLIFQGEAYRGMHSISERKWDIVPESVDPGCDLGTATRSGDVLHRGVRVSLTVRHVWPLGQVPTT